MASKNLQIMNSSGLDPRLLRLEIKGVEGALPQMLSQTSILFIHQVAYFRPLAELCFENVEHGYMKDWEVIAEVLDYYVLETRLFSACNLNPPGDAEASLEGPEGIFEASASGSGASPGDIWASFKILEASPGVRDALASGSVASPGNTGVSFEVPETSPEGQNSTSAPKDACHTG
ncbi:hypothetical protein BGZ59_001850 [Podila verticillata]|nr:hypothetical protein BGZ59_001850 [Podila verticillata]